MTNQIKILIGIFLIIILIGAFYIYNKILIPEKPIIPEKLTPEKPAISPERVSPKLNVSTPSALEIAAYKSLSFNFSIENEQGYSEAKDVNVTLTLGETPILVTPNNVNIGSGELQNFQAELNKIPPGDFNLYLKIKGQPDISISKTILVKSQIVVGIDGYHTYGYYGPGSIWKEKFECGNHNLCTGRNYAFVKNLNENNIKTTIIESPLSFEILKDINTFIILAPDINRPLSSNEIIELKKFLNNNGGLLLIAPQYYTHNGDKNCITNLIDLIKSLHLEIKEFTLRYPPVGLYTTEEEWTKEITQHPVTSGIEEILYDGVFTFEVEVPLISLVKLHGSTIYAIQYYSKGKIGIIGSDSVLRYGERCHQCQELNLNLIKWLVTPPTSKELEELG